MTAHIRTHAKPLAAMILIAVSYLLARAPELSADARARLASRFLFEPHQISGDASGKGVRIVHPSLHRISAWISSVGAAVALADLDGDGLPNDACLVDPRRDAVTIVAVAARDRYVAFDLRPGRLHYDDRTMAPMGCLAADVNEDGLPDPLVYFWGRTSVAYVRRPGPLGAAGFDAVEIVSGAAAAARWYTNALTMADVDGDGHDDLIVANYFQDGAAILGPASDPPQEMQQSMSRASNGGSKHLLRWAGRTGGAADSVRYLPVENAIPADLATAWTLAVGAADLDGDLLPELYFANDFGPDHFLHNRSRRGEVRFAPLVGQRSLTSPASKVLGRDSFKGMGVDFEEISGDGVTDIIVSNIAAEYALEESHFAFIGTGSTDLMRNGIAPYQDHIESLGLSRSSWAWDLKAADFDNDGCSEIVQATGFVAGNNNRWPELQELAMGNDALLNNPAVWPRIQPGDGLSPGRLFFFVRDAAGRFHDVAADVGLARAQISRGLATADVDGDGRLDFAVANQWEPSFLYRNTSTHPASFLQLTLVRDPDHANVSWAPATRTPGPALPAIGAEVSVALPDGVVRHARVDAGNGHGGRRSADVHIGLGGHPRDLPLATSIRWRSRGGVVRSARIELPPGRHLIRLPW